MELQTSIAEANKKIAEARGDSASKVITAQGEAEAIKVKQQQITPTYVEYVKWYSWDGHMPSVMTGAGSGIMLNMAQPK